ncbi:hypothetical protein [Mesorhizobium sp. WSM3873]|uniref:hypothetical protein n=1 Tax=Mesorhizobium sp. WSM3873 TaxID=1854056 RepID=UPI0008019C50|nr:hypothetical protein [Mesorhizobium sp. WSM3873]OBQ83618.1 hypothetical protein A9K71_23950 [Mesorhizobium sp. WSM3873]
MLPATDGATPSADRFAALDALRRRVAIQSCAVAGEGVKARRVLFSLDLPAIDLRTALDNFERAIVEHDDRPVVAARRLRCLAVLDGIVGG